MNSAVPRPTTSILPTVYDGVTHTQRMVMLAARRLTARLSEARIAKPAR